MCPLRKFCKVNEKAGRLLVLFDCKGLGVELFVAFVFVTPRQPVTYRLPRLPTLLLSLLVFRIIKSSRSPVPHGLAAEAMYFLFYPFLFFPFFFVLSFPLIPQYMDKGEGNKIENNG